MALGSTQPLTEMSTRSISWGVKAAGAWGWQPYHHPGPFSRNLGTLTSWNPLSTSGLLWDWFTFIVYKAVIKPIWSYGIELWGCASKSNTVIMQRSKILRAIANAPRYVTNHTLNTDLNISYVSDVIHERINNHHNKLEAHPNPLLEPILQTINTRRLKRCWPLDLQGTWGDIVGWKPYHVTEIHGIVAYFV